MNLDKFEKYKKIGKVQEMNFNKSLWGYTRVSSKEQSVNYSIEEQKRSIEAFAKSNGFSITKFHGGTYESAKGDLSRKEFKLLYENVRKSKDKPFAIAIKFINRFSRSGASAIGLVEELVHEIGVHLIETSSGLTTETIEGRIAIQEKLLQSQKENIQRLKHTLPGLKEFLENGNWLGKVPRGYHIVEYSGRKRVQEIKINDEGKILKKAWKWKANGMADVDIRYKLLDIHNYKITKQNLSAMWRKPFYVGVNNNAMLDKVVKGNWPALISMKIWDRVQNRLESATRKSGYEKSLVSEYRPLTNFIYCSKCGAAITSYIAKKKNIHYYKCQHGKGGNMNAFTTPRSSKPGVNDSFADFLKQFELSEANKELLKAQILQLTKEYHHDKKDQKISLNKELVKLQNKLDKVNEKFILSENADEGSYVKIKNKLHKEIREIEQKLRETPEKISNQENLIDKALSFCQNLRFNWTSGDIHQKLKIQKTLFPDGLIINLETRQYRTKKLNQLLSVIEDTAKDSEDLKIKKATRKGGLSSAVAGTGLEPVTFGL